MTHGIRELGNMNIGVLICNESKFGFCLLDDKDP